MLEYSATGPQSLKQTAKINVRIRADVGKYRDAPAGPLLDRRVEYQCVQEPSATKAHFVYSGEADLFGPDGRNSFFVQWIGAGDVVPSTDFAGAFLVIRGTIDTATRVLRMEILPSSREIFKYRSHGKFDGGVLGGQSDELYPGLVTIVPDVFDFSEPTNYGVDRKFLQVTLDAQWAIPPRDRTVDAKPPTEILIGFLDGEIKTIPTRLRWDTVSASKPPRESESRSR